MGGINTLWPLFGISNQMLAGIALILSTVILFKMKRAALRLGDDPSRRSGSLICTLTAGLQKVFSDDPTIGFLAHARKFADAACRWTGPGPGEVAGRDAAGSSATTMSTRRLPRCSSPLSLPSRSME